MSLLNNHIANLNYDFSTVNSLNTAIESGTANVFDLSVKIGAEFKKFSDFYGTKAAKQARENDDIHVTKKEYLSQCLNKSYSQIAKLVKAAKNAEHIEAYKADYQRIVDEYNLSLGQNIEKFNNYVKFCSDLDSFDAICKAYKLGEFSESEAEEETESTVIFQFVSKCEERGNISTHVKSDGAIGGSDVAQTIERLQEMINLLQS